MVLPIIMYGHPVLRKKGEDIDDFNEEVSSLIDNMWETMYNASGVGIAAPQVNKAWRLFLVDTEQLFENMDEEDQENLKGQSGIKKEFINPRIIKTGGSPYAYNEGCLSIPGIREDITRDAEVEIEYEDRLRNKVLETYTGINARVILHEYDHIEGRLFVDYVKPIKKKLLKKKLDKISKGEVKTSYKILAANRQ